MSRLSNTGALQRHLDDFIGIRYHSDKIMYSRIMLIYDSYISFRIVKLAWGNRVHIFASPYFSDL